MITLLILMLCFSLTDYYISFTVLFPSRPPLPPSSLSERWIHRRIGCMFDTGQCIQMATFRDTASDQNDRERGGEGNHGSDTQSYWRINGVIKSGRECSLLRMMRLFSHRIQPISFWPFEAASLYPYLYAFDWRL